MKNIKKVLYMAMTCTMMIGMIGVCGCGASENNQQNGVSEEIVEGETEMEYSKKSAELLQEALNCEQKNAESILRSLGRQNIGELSKAVLLDSADGYQVEIETEVEQKYVLYIDKKNHLYAIQKDNQQGEYVYREME